MSDVGQKAHARVRSVSALPPLADMLKNPSENNATDFQKSLRRKGNARPIWDNAGFISPEGTRGAIVTWTFVAMELHSERRGRLWLSASIPLRQLALGVAALLFEELALLGWAGRQAALEHLDRRTGAPRLQ